MGFISPNAPTPLKRKPDSLEPGPPAKKIRQHHDAETLDEIDHEAVEIEAGCESASDATESDAGDISFAVCYDNDNSEGSVVNGDDSEVDSLDGFIVADADNDGNESFSVEEWTDNSSEEDETATESVEFNPVVDALNRLVEARAEKKRRAAAANCK